MAKILVVDDESKIRKIFNKLLTYENYEVLEAEDCRSASRLLVEEKEIQLVLLHFNMPTMDGSVLYRTIRVVNPKVKVIVTSAFPIQDQKARIECADDYYDKSQGTPLLIEKIKKFLPHNVQQA